MRTRERTPGRAPRLPARPGPGAPAGEAQAEQTQAAGTGEETEERDQPQDVWAARRDLVDHSPRTMNIGARTRFGGGTVHGDQNNLAGNQITGDVFLGGKTEVHHWSFAGLSGSATVSGEVPRQRLERLDASFTAAEETVGELLDRLRRDRVLVLSGTRFSGRRTAALVLLHRLGAVPVHVLDRDTAPGSSPTGSPAPAPAPGSGRSAAMCWATWPPGAGVRCASPICWPRAAGSRSRTPTW
ncbi:hypothetical protein ACFQ3Z_27600 [Streptomyces nogalater]